MNASIAPCAAHSISQQAEASIGTGRCRGYSAAVLTSSRHPTPVFTPGTLFSAAALLDCCVSAPGLRQRRGRLFVTVDVFFFLITTVLLVQMTLVSKPLLFSNPVVCGGRGKGERREWGHPCVRTDGWPSKRPRI